MSKFQCARCGEDRPRLEKPPFRGDLGATVHNSICVDCWKAWLAEQTIAMNEKRLNLSKPEHVELIGKMMLTFLNLST